MTLVSTQSGLLVPQAALIAKAVSDFGAVGDAGVVVVVVDSQEGGMKDEEFSVVPDQSARMIHLGEDGKLVGDAGAFGIDATNDPAAVRLFAE